MGAFLVGAFREALWTILLSGLAALGALLIGLVCMRLWLKAQAWRRARLELRYAPLVNALTGPETAGAAIAALTRAPQRHLDVIGRLVLRPLALTEGQMVDYLRAGATTIGLASHWRTQLRSPRWWDRASAVHALGLLRKPGMGADVLPVVNDVHEEVRAAAVGALGWLADPATVPALLTALSDETRHQKVRIIEALQRVGQAAGPAVLDYIRRRPVPDPLLADLIGHLRLTTAVDLLLDWTSAPDPAMRAAAFRTLGILGLDDRAFYFALKGLGDADATVVAMAARALGRAGRTDAVPYLAALLTREWHIAVEAAQSLHRLGPEGLAALEARAGVADDVGALASHVLWEGRLSAAR